MKRALMAVLCAIAPAVASAQDVPKIGLTMGYPSAIGILWNAADRVALRPEFTWSKGSGESPAIVDPILGTPGNATTSDNWQTGVGVSALFYIGRYESLRTYVSPRVTYSRSSLSSGSSGTLASTNSTSDGWSTSGSFGAQYAIGRHFGLFGEVGLNYASSTTRTTFVESITTFAGIGAGGVIMTTATSFTVRSESHTHSVSSRSGVGVIFFF